MNDSITPSDLARWLKPAGIELGSDRLAELAGVVTELTDGLEGRELEAVRAACGHLSDGARAFAAETLGEKAPTVIPQDATELLERLLAVAVVASLDESESGIRCALAVGSAQFLGMTPLIEDLPARAAEALASAGRSARRRVEIDKTVASKALGALPKARKRNEETGEEISPNELADDLADHARSLGSLVNALDQAIGGLAKRQDTLDEEVEMLWWALRATDDSGTAFSDLEPAARAVSAAGELADRTDGLPGPPSAGFLLKRVLDNAADDEITLADLAAAASEHLRPLDVPPDPLLALMSAATEQARLSADKDDKTWQTVVERTLGVDLSAKTTLATGAQQVYRELLLERLLTEDE
jgi:hypothetical protein